MSMTGVVHQWMSDKGYGFIRPAGGGSNVFCHSSALGGFGSSLVVAAPVRFDIGAGKNGKPQAVTVSGPGVIRAGNARSQRAQAKAGGSGEVRGKAKGKAKGKANGELKAGQKASVKSQADEELTEMATARARAYYIQMGMAPCDAECESWYPENHRRFIATREIDAIYAKHGLSAGGTPLPTGRQSEDYVSDGSYTDDSDSDSHSDASQCVSRHSPALDTPAVDVDKTDITDTDAYGRVLTCTSRLEVGDVIPCESPVLFSGPAVDFDCPSKSVLEESTVRKLEALP